MEKYRFIDEFGSFEWENAENDPQLYFPLAGENGMKSAVTPNLGGDCKTDQNHFLLEPVSAENLRNNRSVRNFWCLVEGKRPWSAVGASAWQEAKRMTSEQEESKVRAGFMWHEAERIGTECGLKSTVTTFVDVTDPVEVSRVQIENITDEPIAVKLVAAIPIYGRSADNIRDHRHVTSLLHRIHTTEYGVHVTPTLSFDERGHQKNNCTYFTEGAAFTKETTKLPEGFYPTMESFIGESGTFMQPAALYQKDAYSLTEAGVDINGQEALGGISFEEVVLQPKESAVFIVFLGMEENLVFEEIERLRSRYFIPGGFEERLSHVKEYWQTKVRAGYYTGDTKFDNFMKWVSFQPELRRLFGCSFLPHHDYGRGGRGWRDLWQDCLALLLSDPYGVRSLLHSNYGGVRADGTNATIIGDKQGEFKADRNSITRVWSDHGIWPFVTTKLYLDQTGDFDFLYEDAAYFKDAQVMRGKDRDMDLTEEDPQMKDNIQRDVSGNIAMGTVLEHILTENLTSFYEVGEHNHMLLRDADWNDALDLAGHRGETVAFTCALAMNLKDISDLLLHENKRGQKEVTVMEELLILLDEGISCDSIHCSEAWMACLPV